MDELPRIADRITVLRDGKSIETRRGRGLSADEIVRAMVGRALDVALSRAAGGRAGAPRRFSTCAISTREPVVRDVRFSVRAGEIVGLAGLVGAGRTEIVRAIAGADVPRSRRDSRSTASACGSGAPDDAHRRRHRVHHRRSQGAGSGARNDAFARTSRSRTSPSSSIAICSSTSRANARPRRRMIDELHIRTPSTEQLVRNLSGGNQQKVVLAKWLLGNARVFLFDEPTRGIDVGAKAEIYKLMLELAARGAAIVMVSSDLPEVLGMSHRILVVRDGRIAAEFARARCDARARSSPPRRERRRERNASGSPTGCASPARRCFAAASWSSSSTSRRTARSSSRATSFACCARSRTTACSASGRRS